MKWVAVVPLKQGRDRKSRLAGRLSFSQRIALSDYMAAHVLACLAASPAIEEVILLSPAPAAGHGWKKDEGRGLNAELEALRAELGKAAMLVVHGDLPLIAPLDIEALVEAAAEGCALAPDRHDSGTNALALLAHAPFTFAFGMDSFARHQAAADGKAAVVRRFGLACDIDTPGDLDVALRAGALLPI